ncbi:Protein of unknown function DUF2418 [Lasallia pustulata]|uniref:Uncharacterized protein n=1 Tax=Lasallia pustulata TaxID=136370 RepID=A0A1W5DCM1_9LECA|nr:Protein of unknown function DUF2418 [Lasallia pustulata]
MSPRLIRRQPLADRIKAYLNPLDFLLWLSEELDSSDWDRWQKEWATPIGIGLNVIFMLARANSGAGGRRKGDDVFGEDIGGSGWFSWFAAFIVHLLSLLSFLNAAYTFYRKRHYRLFEQSVDAPPSTPSAHRVRVDSSPLSSSPLRFLQHMIASTAAEARAHPDAARDVWEIAVWDPTPLCLRMFCLFSPGHILVYFLFLPTAPQDPRPSITVVTTIVLAALLSTQLLLLQSSFSQQSKDTSVIQKEVLHEYDTKYVHPRTQPLVRDVGTQYSTPSPSPSNPPHHDPETNTPPAEPYEVAPGILSTDATAKVFGYLDVPEDKHKERGKSAAPDKRNRSRDRVGKEKQGGCSPARKLYELYKEAHTDDGLDDFRGRTHRRKVEEWDRKRQERRDEAREEREESARRGRRGRMLTVSKEDELVSRGANPRTGVVTPWEGSELSGEGGSWLGRGRGDTLAPGTSRESSGKWTQEENGWSLIPELGSSPARRADGGKSVPIPGLSVKGLEDRFVVNMPGVDDPNPTRVTAEQIRFYRDGVDRAYRKAGDSHGLVNPETLPTPRTQTPEGPSTPPTRLQKIPRKEVGSAVREREGSTGTVLVNRQATTGAAIAAISPTFRNDMSETPKVKIVPPSSFASPASKRSDRDHRGQLPKQINTQRPFLGPQQDGENSPIANVIPSHSPPSTPPKPNPLRQAEPNAEEATLAPQQLFRTLSQYLPPLSFLHPSYFANLPAPHHDQTPRLPEKAKKPPKGPRASTITTPITTTTTTTTTEKKQRPRVGRQGGTNSVPRANLRAFKGQRKWWEQQKKQTETKPEEEKNNQHHPMRRPPAAQEVQAEPNQSWGKGDKYNGWVVADQSADGAEAPIPDEKVAGMGRGKRFTIGEHVRQNKSKVGCIGTDDPLDDGTMCNGNDGQNLELRMRAMANERERRVEVAKGPGLEVPPEAEAIADGNAWFAFSRPWGYGNGKEGVACVYDGAEEEGEEGADDDDDDDEAGEKRLESGLVKGMVDLWNAVGEMEKTFDVSSAARWMSTRLFGMAQHILVTLHPTSPALEMLRTTDARVADYMHAVRALVLAGVYLLALVHIIMTVGNAVRVSMTVLVCAWWPVQAALVVVRWLALG